MKTKSRLTRTPALATLRLPRVHLQPPARLRRRNGTRRPPVRDLAAPRPAPAPLIVEEPAPPVHSAAPRDSLQLYLREIGQVKLLTPQEEIALARRIKRGDERAREQMIKANLRLVVKIARDYEGYGLPLLDLINEGNIGLMKGVERFKPGKGAKLSTYASWWIKQSIKRALDNQSKTIRLPVHVVDKINQLRRAEMKLRETLDRDPTDEELGEALRMDPRRVTKYRTASSAPVSLDAPVGHDEDANRFADVVADPNAAAPFDKIIRDTDAELVREVLPTLTERERSILSRRFGLEDGTPRTLEEVGVHFGVTRERIRQIQEEALGKLRARMRERDQPSPAADESEDLALTV